MKKSFFLSKKGLIYSLIGLVVIIAVVFSVNNGDEKQLTTVVRADVIQKVAATGKAKANRSVDLGFDKSGRVADVRAEVGDKVKKGQIIAALESGEVSADLAKARAALQEENSKLREIKNTAPISYGDATKNLEAAIKEGFGDADNAIRNKIDQFFKDPSGNPRFEISIISGNLIHYFNVSDNLKIDINNDRRKVESILDDWQKRISGLNSSNVVSEADKAINDLNTISAFLDKMASAVNTFTAVDFDYETTVSGYKTSVSGARSDVSAAISSVVTAKGKLTSAPTLGEAGQFENILAQEAKVAQAAAAVSSLEAALGKSAIVAPFDGVVTLQDAKPGAAVSGGETVVSMMSEADMYVEANISEINIGKIMAGNPISVSFDAFPGEEFSGEVSYIEPGEAIIDGVVSYKIRVSIGNLDSKIKSGLTANLSIQTAKKENVLTVPLYAVVRENNQTFVNKIVAGGDAEKVPVVLGLSGNEGFAEVVSGLEEGDTVEY